MQRTNEFGDRMLVYTAGPCGGENNYSYIIVDKATGNCAVTDPSQCADDVIKICEGSGWKPTTILTTHHHWDHAYANQKMADLYPEMEVVGGEEDIVEACTKAVVHGDKFEFAPGIQITCLNTRGHTDGHMCYLVSAEGAEEEAVFTGDCMFVGGCGRCLEGTYTDMWKDLSVTLGGLKPKTKVFVGHEYTVQNYQFGCSQDPGNAEMLARLEWAMDVRKDTANGICVPTTIEEEWKTNIFMRCADEGFQTSHPDFNKESVTNSFELFSVMRKRKDGTMRITSEMLRGMDGMIPGKYRRSRNGAVREVR